MKLRISTVFSVILLLLSGCTCFNRCVHTDPEETAIFEEQRGSFELVNNYILDNFGHLEDSNILLVRDEDEVIYSLYNNGKDVELTDELKRALNAMGDVIRYNFNNIKMEKDRITYGGDTYRQYVYSRNGKAPSYFYYEGDEMPMTVYKLPGNWYLMTVHFI